MKNNTKWMWCSKCNKGKGRWSTSHGTSNHDPNFFNKNKKTGTQSKGNVNVTASAPPPESSMGVWCTALDTGSAEDITTNMVLMYFLFGLLIGICTAVKSYQVLTTLSSPTYHILFWNLRTQLIHLLWKFFGLISGLISTNPLLLLQISMLTWISIFIGSGSVPIDILLEQYLSGGRQLYYSSFTTSHVIMTMVISFLKVIGILFIQHIEFLHEFVLDIFQHENVWFLAPLSWMITTYIVLFLHRRLSLFKPIHPVRTSEATIQEKPVKGRTNKHKIAYSKYKNNVCKSNIGPSRRNIGHFKTKVGNHGKSIVKVDQNVGNP